MRELLPQIWGEGLLPALWLCSCMFVSALLALIMDNKLRKPGERPFRWGYFFSAFLFFAGISGLILFAETFRIALVGPVFCCLGMAAITRNRWAQLLTLLFWPFCAAIALLITSVLGPFDFGIFLALSCAGCLFLHCAYLKNRWHELGGGRGGENGAHGSRPGVHGPLSSVSRSRHDANGLPNACAEDHPSSGLPSHGKSPSSPGSPHILPDRRDAL